MADDRQAISRMRRSLAVLNGESSAETITDPDPKKPIEPIDEKPEGQPGETGGPKGPEPTRYGDWERKGRCIDF
jgi:hypothetical protein